MPTARADMKRFMCRNPLEREARAESAPTPYRASRRTQVSASASRLQPRNTSRISRHTRATSSSCMAGNSGRVTVSRPTRAATGVSSGRYPCSR